MDFDLFFHSQTQNQHDVVINLADSFHIVVTDLERYCRTRKTSVLNENFILRRQFYTEVCHFGKFGIDYQRFTRYTLHLLLG